MSDMTVHLIPMIDVWRCGVQYDIECEVEFVDYSNCLSMIETVPVH